MLAGFSRLDITPPLGTPLAGFFSERLASGIVDPIELNAVAFNDGDKTSVIIVADCLGIREDYATKIRSMIEEELGVPSSNVMLTATHSHTSFRLGVVPTAIKSNKRNSLDDPQYIYILLRKFVDAARIAINDMKEATFEIGEAQTSEQISFIRRYRMKDGSVKSFPPKLDPNILHPLGNADNTLRLIRINRKDGKDIAITNFSTHACVVSGTLFSADWPGYIRKYFEESVDGTHCLMLVGAEGDANHVNVNSENLQRGPDEAKRIGRVLAEAAVRAWNTTKPVVADKITSDVRIVYTQTRVEGTERYDEANKLYSDYFAGLTKPHEQYLAEARRIINTRIMPIYQSIPLTVMTFGEIAFVGFGGEPFTEYATRARAIAPDKYVIAAACANGFQGYLPTKQAFADGGYEAVGSYFTPALEDEIMNTVSEMLDEIK